MKLLITGAAGFIGSHFVDYVLDHHPDDTVIGLDKLTYAGNLDNLAGRLQDRRFRFFRADICDREAVFPLLERESVDCIVNFAAESHVDRSLQDPGVFLRTNVLGVGVLLDGTAQFGVSRFHQVSTDEVYGDLPLDRPELKFDEGSPLRPSSPYSASKAAADLLALSYFRSFGTPVTITRSSNNYGPRQYPEKLIPRMIRRARAGRPLPVYGDGRNVRDWIHVLDHCAAVDLVIRKGRVGEVYNVGGGNERSNLDLIRLLLSLMGKDEALISFIADRKGHDRRYAVSTEKISTQLGWRPAVEFNSGIRETIRWYLDRPDQEAGPAAP